MNRKKAKDDAKPKFREDRTIFRYRSEVTFMTKFSKSHKKLKKKS